MRVYLAGSVTADDKHIDWRKDAALVLASHGITAVSPIRFQSPKDFSPDGLHDATVPGSFIAAVDVADLKRCDAVLLRYHKGLVRQSIGTWAEFGMAALLGLPIVVVTDDPSVRDHPFIQRFAAIVVDTPLAGLGWITRIRIPTAQEHLGVGTPSR